MHSNESTGTIDITDITGNEIVSIFIQGKNGQHVWDTRATKPGVYIYKFTADGSSVSGKLIIK